MEQKRTLWILIAAGVFLCVVICVAWVAYGPTSTREVTATSLRDSGSVWVSPTTQDDEQSITLQSSNSDVGNNTLAAGVSVPQEGNTVLSTEGFSGNASALASNNNEGVSVSPVQTEIQSSGSSIYTQTDRVTVIANGTTNVYQMPDSTTAQANTTTIDLNTLKNGGANSSATSATPTVTAQNQAAAQAMKATEDAREQKSNIAKTLDESTKRTSSASASKSSSSAKSSAVAKAPSAPKTSAIDAGRTPDRYWVQAASYSSKKKADEARSLLDEKQIQCEVFTYENGTGSLYYRVRVGPYSTKDEAAYWKKQVDAIDFFAKADTYIVNSSAPAPLAKK